MSSEYLETAEVSYKVYKKYQTIIHGVPAVTITEDEYIKFLVKSPLQVIIMITMVFLLINFVKSNILYALNRNNIIFFVIFF